PFKAVAETPRAADLRGALRRNRGCYAEAATGSERDAGLFFPAGGVQCARNSPLPCLACQAPGPGRGLPRASEGTSPMATHDLPERLSRIQTAWSDLFQAHQGDTSQAAEVRGRLLLRYHGAVYRYLQGV